MRTITESNLLRSFLGGLLLLALAAMPGLAQTSGGGPGEQPPGAVGYDIERQTWLFDTDGDTFPDLTEELGGTDPLDPNSNPLVLLEEAAGHEANPWREGKVGFTRMACRGGFWWVPTGLGAPLLCISLVVQNATNYTQAAANCRTQGARVCTYEDLGYIYLSTTSDANFDPSGKWLADFTVDNWVNCGNATITFNNDPDIWDFEGTCDKRNNRPYWCCHDRDPQHPAP
ncbi:MAG TPA: hypothetical protein VF179_14460 [Thermoanaerobaculia bacterium]|nr:hypothetical protein [Thermoanaerobaculia bacterium]